MTTELEKQFFDTFGIEPAYFYECSYKDKLDFGLNPSDDECPAKKSNIRCNACNLGKKVLVGYRGITDSILLELICILSVALKPAFVFPKRKTVEKMKEWVLQACITQEEGIYTRVRTLFKE